MTRPTDESEYRGDGLSDREREVLTLWDGGWSIQRIAKQLGQSATNIGSIISRFHVDAEDNDWARMVATGSRQLAAAIAMTGKAFA